MSIENELVQLTIRDLLSLIDNPSDTYQEERRWLSENTSVVGWGHILPLSLANQILAKDPNSQVVRILTYEPIINKVKTTISVGITPASLRESGETRRMAQQKMGPIHSARTQRNDDIEACSQIIDAFKRRLRVPKALIDTLGTLAEKMAKQVNYNAYELQIAIDKLVSGIE